DGREAELAEELVGNRDRRCAAGVGERVVIEAGEAQRRAEQCAHDEAEQVLHSGSPIATSAVVSSMRPPSSPADSKRSVTVPRKRANSRVPARNAPSR